VSASQRANADCAGFFHDFGATLRVVSKGEYEQPQTVARIVTEFTVIQAKGNSDLPE